MKSEEEQKVHDEAQQKANELIEQATGVKMPLRAALVALAMGAGFVGSMDNFKIPTDNRKYRSPKRSQAKKRRHARQQGRKIACY